MRANLSYPQPETIMKCLFCRLISSGLCHKQLIWSQKPILKLRKHVLWHWGSRGFSAQGEQSSPGRNNILITIISNNNIIRNIVGYNLRCSYFLFFFNQLKHLWICGLMLYLFTTHLNNCLLSINIIFIFFTMWR